MTAQVHDARQCALGEGPLWHPVREQFFWFDILNRRLMSQVEGAPVEWVFDEIVSAAGWTGRDTLLIASETQLFNFNLVTGAQDHITPLEANDPTTRSNDGRADPNGGFWIGTMGKAAEPHAGAIYRYFKGELRRVFSKVTIPNSICFDPSGRAMYFCDTLSGRIMCQQLTDQGWPQDDPHLLVDLRNEGLNPDGSVTDEHGYIWNAQWGASRIAQYDPLGSFVQAIDIPARNTSCPAFGGPDLSTLFCTTAQEHLDAATLKAEPLNGQTFKTAAPAKGWPEPQVIL